MADGWICSECEREIVPRLIEFNGINRLLESAIETIEGDGDDEDGDAWDSDMVKATVAGTIRLKCSCSYLDITKFGEVRYFEEKIPRAWVSEVIDE